MAQGSMSNYNSCKKIKRQEAVEGVRQKSLMEKRMRLSSAPVPKPGAGI
jgi:hypothetical protein